MKPKSVTDAHSRNAGEMIFLLEKREVILVELRKVLLSGTL